MLKNDSIYKPFMDIARSILKNWISHYSNNVQLDMDKEEALGYASL